MNELSSIITFCIWFGTGSLCVVLIFWGILRWLRNERDKKLNIMAWIAFTVLCTMFAIRYETKGLDAVVAGSGQKELDENGYGIGLMDEEQENGENIEFVTAIGSNVNSKALTFFLKISKNVIEMVLIGVVAFLAIVILLIVIRCITSSLKIIWKTKTETVDKDSFAFINAIKAPVVILVISWGIIALFCVLPFLMGEWGKGNLIEIWQDGTCKITNLFSPDNGAEGFSFEVLISYILIYIIIMGVGFAVVKILHSIIGHTLKERKSENLIDEYSSPIALLAVGVAILWTLKGEQFDDKIKDLLKSVVSVIFIFAIIVLTLEIIRLLINMRDNFIRLEARYLFISLVGQSALLILGMLNFIYGTINNTIGSTEDTKIEKIEVKLRNKLVNTMDKAIEPKKKFPNDEQKLTFWPFDEKVTKK